MKTRFLLMAVCCLLGSMLISCEKAKGETTADNSVDKEKIKSDILAMESAYADAINIGDANTAAKYYADDAQSFHSGELPLIGKAAIVESLKKEIAEVPAGSKVSFQTMEVMISSDGNQVVETGKYNVSDSSNPEMASGNFISVFEKRGDTYVCIRDMAVNTQPKK